MPPGGVGAEAHRGRKRLVIRSQLLIDFPHLVCHGAFRYARLQKFPKARHGLIVDLADAAHGFLLFRVLYRTGPVHADGTICISRSAVPVEQRQEIPGKQIFVHAQHSLRIDPLCQQIQIRICIGKPHHFHARICRNMKHRIDKQAGRTVPPQIQRHQALFCINPNSGQI